MGTIKNTVINTYKLKLCLLIGISGFVLNFIPISLSFGDLKFSILIGVFGAFFVAQVWGLKYGLLTALFGSTQSMWFLWSGDGLGMLYSVPVFTLWIVWHGYWSDRRRASKNKRIRYNQYLQELFIRLIIEAGFWTIFPLLVSLNPPDMAGVAHEVSQKFLVNILIKHTANAYIMLLVTEVLVNLKGVKRIFLIKKKEINPKFIFAFVLLWTVLFWFLESLLKSAYSEQLLNFYQTYSNPETLEIMFVHYPITSFWLRIIFAVFLSLAAYLIYSLYIREKKNYKRFHNLFENSNDIILLCEQDGQVIEVNSNARNLFEEDQVSLHLKHLLTGAKESVFRHLQTSNSNLRFSTQFTKTKEATYDCLINCVDLEKRQWLLIARDMTKRIEMEEKLQELNLEIEASYEELQTSFEELEENNIVLNEKNDLINKLFTSIEEIMNAVPDLIIRIDQNYTIQWTNKAFKEYIGKDLTGNHLYEALQQNDFKLEKKCFENLFPCHEMKSITQQINEGLIVQITSLPVQSNDDAIVIIRDMTKIKLREKYYLEAKTAAEKANRLKDEFLANISHELRTPMNGILTALNLINYSSNIIDAETSEYLSIIRQSSARLLRTINELLEIKRMENREIEVNIAAINTADFVKDFKNQYSVFAKQKNIDFKMDVSKDFPQYFLSDEDKITHILSNLVFNAIKFTQKGFVKLKLDSEYVNANKRKLTFSVIDSGIGIEKEKQKLIFDKFSQVDNSYTRKYEGTGLGLAISKNLAHALHSKLKVQSEPGKGSTFYFTLDTTICNQKMYEEPLPDQEALQTLRNRKPRIFLAEDDRINSKLLRKLLEKYHCTVEVFENGQALLNRINSKHPDLILMDIEMPVLNGIETAKHLKKRADINKIPIIALSGHTFSDKKEEMLHAGFNDCITKPVDKGELIKVLLLYT